MLQHGVREALNNDGYEDVQGGAVWESSGRQIGWGRIWRSDNAQKYLRGAEDLSAPLHPIHSELGAVCRCEGIYLACYQRREQVCRDPGGLIDKVN